MHCLMLPRRRVSFHLSIHSLLGYTGSRSSAFTSFATAFSSSMIECLESEIGVFCCFAGELAGCSRSDCAGGYSCSGYAAGISGCFSQSSSEDPPSLSSSSLSRLSAELCELIFSILVCSSSKPLTSSRSASSCSIITYFN